VGSTQTIALVIALVFKPKGTRTFPWRENPMHGLAYQDLWLPCGSSTYIILSLPFPLEKLI